MKITTKVLGLRLLRCTVILVSLASCQSMAAEVPTVSRLVKLFSDLEEQMAADAHARKSDAVAHLLADDFELRAAANPGTPLARVDFLKQIKDKPAPAYTAEQMAVHEIGSVWVVSYLMRPSVDAQALFIVDIWSGDLMSPQLRVRYSAPAAGAAKMPSKITAPLNKY